MYRSIYRSIYPSMHACNACRRAGMHMRGMVRSDVVWYGVVYAMDVRDVLLVCMQCVQSLYVRVHAYMHVLYVM